jgi:hypothetical protein
MITVTIPKDKLDRFDNVVNRGMYLLKELQAAGVPALGSLWPEAVEHGALTVRTDAVFEDRIYEWRPE